MFKLEIDPTFDANVEIRKPGGGSQTIRVTYRYMPKSAYNDLFKEKGQESAIVLAQDIVVGWEEKDDKQGRYQGMPMPFSAEAMEQLDDAQPRAMSAIIATYVSEMQGFGLKN